MLAIKCMEMTTILKLYSVVAKWLLPKKLYYWHALVKLRQLWIDDRS